MGDPLGLGLRACFRYSTPSAPGLRRGGLPWAGSPSGSGLGPGLPPPSADHYPNSRRTDYRRSNPNNRYESVAEIVGLGNANC